MSLYSRTALVSPVRDGRKSRVGQRSMVLALLATVIVLDQAMKWWAWRHAADPFINYGGDPLVAAKVGRLYAAPVTGALLDLMSVGLLGIAVTVLLRRRRPTTVLVPGALLIGGWSSNLLDRLGMHYWTAPGSVRGVVDFIHLGSLAYNVADFIIIICTLPFFVAMSASYLRRWAASRPATTGSRTPKAHRWPRARTWAWMSASAGAIGLIAVVGLGAAHYGGVTAPDTTATLPSAR
jgi:lipoprotein signal peptidase